MLNNDRAERRKFNDPLTSILLRGAECDEFKPRSF